jgi:hypothetical protein
LDSFGHYLRYGGGGIHEGWLKIFIIKIVFIPYDSLFLVHPYHYRSQQRAQQLAAVLNCFLFFAYVIGAANNPHKRVTKFVLNFILKYIVAINEFYYQLKPMYSFLRHVVCISKWCWCQEIRYEMHANNAITNRFHRLLVVCQL